MLAHSYLPEYAFPIYKISYIKVYNYKRLFIVDIISMYIFRRFLENYRNIGAAVSLLPERKVSSLLGTSSG